MFRTVSCKSRAVCLRSLFASSSNALGTGISSIAVATPTVSLSQSVAESFDGVAAGKYTIGLGQQEMGIVGDDCDAVSLASTALTKLFETEARVAGAARDVGRVFGTLGRLEVGTETPIDKSKSIKTFLLPVLEEYHGREVATSVEGVDCINACYGGTAALFNAVDWVNSPYWNGKDALVVAVDLAVYEKGPARPTGGAAAIAMRIGRDSVLPLEGGIRGHHFEHVFDFYKPHFDTEFPSVDGQLSIECYIRALDSCYARYCASYEAATGRPFTMAEAGSSLFHSPFTKLVRRSYSRLRYLDHRREAAAAGVTGGEVTAAGITLPYEMSIGMGQEESGLHRPLVKALDEQLAAEFDQRVDPTLLSSYRIGNSYTASMYMSLASLVSERGADLAGSRISAFSYGSGLAASMFSLVPPASAGPALAQMADEINLKSVLEARRQLSGEEADSLLASRLDTKTRGPWTPVTSTAAAPGVTRLAGIDSEGRRSYQKTPSS